MNRNVVRASFVALVTFAALLLGSPGAQAKPIEIGNVNNVSAGGFWIKVTPYPSRYGSLTSIAGSVYGNRGLWTKIYQANRRTISNPDLIQIGQRIYVPRLGNVHNVTKSSTRASRTNPTAARWVHPLNVRVSSCYGPRWGTIHQGIDYDGNTGDAIRAVGKGKVVKAGWWAGGYGISVLVQHSATTYTHYAHMSKLGTRVGRTVKAGQVIGFVGATGHATGSHLHFEVWRGMWHQIDPRGWLRAHGLRAGC
jgi:murein DD-endopeptidase MepM/ murein hydrolase activator NlpD